MYYWSVTLAKQNKVIFFVNYYLCKLQNKGLYIESYNEPHKYSRCAFIYLFMHTRLYEIAPKYDTHHTNLSF